MIATYFTRLVDWIDDLSNRLWVRLSLAFAIVSLIGVIMTTLIGVLVFTANVQEFDIAAGFSASGGPVDVIEQYVQQNPDGVGLELVMAGLQGAYPRDPNSISISFSYMDSYGNIVFNGHPEDTSPWPYDRFDGLFPISVSGSERGTLRIMRMAAFEDWNAEDAFFGWLRDEFGIIAAVGMAVGLVFGVVISRSISAPLRQLAAAARALGGRDLTQRVKPSGSSEMVQVGTAFNDMADALQQAETLRRNLVADVAHELRTPLTVLQGNLRAILDDVYDMSKTEIANVYDQTRVLNRLINDLHELAQAEANQLPLHMGPLDMSRVVRRLASTFETVCEAQDVQLIVDVPETSPIINGDSARLSQVVNNLVNNAIQHTPPGGRITICIRRVEDDVEFSVRDTGRGIPAEHLPKVFERFYRGDRSRSRNTGSAGLGLAIVRAIVDSHHGRVYAQSEGIPCKGTTFVVRLPLYETIEVPAVGLTIPSAV